MNLIAERIIAAKEAKGMTWDDLGEAIGMSPVWTCSACMGMNSMPEDTATALCEVLDLGEDVAKALNRYPTKNWDRVVPTDPLIYRLYEIMGVYGDSLKAVIQEKFGDGIMSAIDFTLDVDREEDPKGPRVVLTMNGKFLPYKRW